MAIKLKIYEIKISLNYIKPLIWRRFQVRDDVKLTRLHSILQVMMGWENYHLYVFDFGDFHYTDPDSIERDEWDLGYLDGSNVKLRDVLLPSVGSKCQYRYDFGDNWEHTIVLEKILDPVPGESYPICIGGARACPPEDCGGTSSYAELLRVLADPEDEEYEDMKEWIGPHFDSEKFTPESANTRLLRRVVMKVANDANNG